MNRPIINLDEATSIRDWKVMKNEVKEWISFFQNISVSLNQVFISVVDAQEVHWEFSMIAFCQNGQLIESLLMNDEQFAEAF